MFVLYILRFGCAAYWILLTVLLLVPHPLGLLGLTKSPWPLSHDRGVHFALFLALTLLADVCRWAIRPRWFFGLLVAYAITVELLQAFVPPRTVEVLDLVENLLGIAVGTGVFWLASWMRKGEDSSD